MTGIDVVARRWERGWELHIDGIGVTQTRSLSRAQHDARDYVELITGARPDAVSISYDLGGMDKRITRLRTARRQATEAQDHAADLARRLVADLRGLGMTGDDIAKVIEVSPQRVSQLSSRTRVTAAAVQRRTSAGKTGA